MLAEQSLHEGNIEEALALLQDQVRKDPSKAEYRTFLFQLLAIMGNWERALTQLKVAGDLDDGTLAMVQTYEAALSCEAFRQEIFTGKRSPLIFGEPPQWVALVIEALRLAAEGKYSQSQAMRDQAFEAAPAIEGSIDGQGFQWLADADPRLGPLMEVIVNGRYYWIPLQNIHVINIEEPVDLRDMVWTPAHFTWANGGEAVGLIPTRYPGSELSEDPFIRLSRKTEWIEQEGGLYFGTGQRMLATDIGEYPLMDIREIILESVDSQQDSDQDQTTEIE
ncbi:MAG: type VI secretion system accessory protein TagJ [Candidatus Sedimenticola sp. (ex Thyasira tokunagai)]